MGRREGTVARSYEFELDSGIRGLGGPLKFAAFLAVAPILLGALGAASSHMAPKAMTLLAFLTLTGVFMGWPLAFFLVIAQSWVVRRVRLTISPEDDRWYLERQTLYGTSRRQGDLCDLDHVDVEPGAWNVPTIRLVGCHESTLAEVICSGDSALRPGRGGTLCVNGDERPLVKGEDMFRVAVAVREHVHAALGKGTGAVRRRG